MSKVLKGIEYKSEDHDYGKLIAYLYGKSRFRDGISDRYYIFSTLSFFQHSKFPG